MKVRTRKIRAGKIYTLEVMLATPTPYNGKRSLDIRSHHTLTH